jgi:hypothetical protein
MPSCLIIDMGLANGKRHNGDLSIHILDKVSLW